MLKTKKPRMYEKLIKERDQAWEERTELILKIKQAEDITERDKLFKRYMDLGFKIKEINERIKLKVNKDVEVEVWNGGISIKNYGNAVIPFEDFEKIVNWFLELNKEADSDARF